MAREYHQTQVYFSAVVLLLRQTKAMGGNVEGHCFGVSLRSTARGGGGGEGRREGAGRMGEGQEEGKGGRDGAACMGLGKGDDGETGRRSGSGAGKGQAGARKGGTLWCAWGLRDEMMERRGRVMAARRDALLWPHRRREAHSDTTPPVHPPTFRWRPYLYPVEHPISKILW
jgi:hypothetical protein